MTGVQTCALPIWLTGLFSAEANYIQTATSLQVSAEANVEKLTYERQPVGDIGLGATWLPGDKNTHYLNTYFTYDNEEVMTADGILTQKNGKDTLEVSTRFEHFPLKMANAFIPDQMVAFTGDIDVLYRTIPVVLRSSWFNSSWWNHDRTITGKQPCKSGYY